MKNWPPRPFLIVPSCMLLLMLTLSGCIPRNDDPPRVALEMVAGDFASPVALADPGDGSGRLFVADQVGVIWIVSDGRKLERPFLDLRDRIIKLNSFYDERGLLGLALHPNFAVNGRLYVSYSAPVSEVAPVGQWDHTTYVSEFTVSSGDLDRADPASERILLAMDKPGYNYEAGHLEFGPDGYLYISTGDSVRDPSTEAGQFAQDTYSLLGKILRLDVDAQGNNNRPYAIPPGNPFAKGGGLPEVFAYGFRNPYRFSFDSRQAFRLLVSDVGQARMEEIDLVIAGGNYGWPIREGTTCFNSGNWNQPLAACSSDGLIEPVVAYLHAGDLSAVIGGMFYHGEALPELEGRYIFGDWGRGNARLFVADPPLMNPGSWVFAQMQVELPRSQPGLGQLLGFGQDRKGELYVLVKEAGVGPTGNTGKVYRLVRP
jgi:glucose/arabinose dehydrogenase